MLNALRIKQLTLFDFYHSLTSLKGLVFIIPYFLFWYLVFDATGEHTVEVLQSAQGLMLSSWLLDDQELALQMFVDRSASLSLYLLIAVSVSPFFIMLAANNQYSSDANRGAFRFILTRTTRTELFLSRFLSVLLLILICTLITSIWALSRAYLQNEDTLLTLSLFTLETFIIIIFYSLPFIAFMSMVSAFAKSGFAALFLGMMLYVLLIIISLWLKPDISYISYLIPSAMKATLFDVSYQNIILSVLALSCYTLIYFLCGWYLFKRRDM